MSRVKVPLFGGLVTNADPEDLDKAFTPKTHNFDTSQSGTLKRREIATRVKILEDRGFSSMFLFRNSKLANAGGAEWLIYCNQRGIIYRMDRFYNDLLYDSYVDNILQWNPSSTPPGQDFLFLFNSDFTTIPKSVTFQPFGDYILVGCGHDYPAKVILAIDGRKMFLDKYTKPTGVYVEDFYLRYPQTYTLTATANTTTGSLTNGDYYYNYAPIYDGVNEIPLDEFYTKDVSVTTSNGVAQVVTQLVMDYDNMSCRLTGLKVYRAYQPANSNAKLSYRQIKNINLLTPSGAEGTVISSSKFFAGRHIMYSPNGFPTVDRIVEAFNTLSNYSTTKAKMTDNNNQNGIFRYKFFVAGSEDDKYSPNNTDYTEVTDTLTGATYYIGGSLFSPSAGVAPPDGMYDMNTYDQQSYSMTFNGNTNTNGFFFSVPILETTGIVNDDGNIDDGGHQNWWSIFDGADVVMMVFDPVANKEVYMGIENCYMGKDKIYSGENIFKTINSHAGQGASLTFENNGGNNVTINETIRTHDRRMVAFNLDSNGDPSQAIADINLDDNVLNNNPTQGQKWSHNDIDLFTVTGDGVEMDYNTSNKEITISFTDKGEADGSVPTSPIGTKYDLRWLHSENHGARMFVANVVLEPDGVSEKHPDMICFSELGRPSIIPISNFISIRDPEGGSINGLKSMGDSLVVLMQYGIYRLRVPSIDPASYSIVESNEHIGCVAPNAIVKVEDTVYFCGANNIYSINSAFQINPIASPILNKWIAELQKELTIAEFDPIKELIIFRFGRVKADAYEYNIRTGEWNKVQVQGDISSMAIGQDGYLHFGDNVHLDITRADGNDNDEPDPPDPDDSDPDPEPDPDNYVDTSDNIWDSTDTIVNEQNANTGFFAKFVWKNMEVTSGSNILEGSNLASSGIGVGQVVSGYGIPEGATVTSINTNAGEVDISANATESSPSDTGFSSLTFTGQDGSTTFFGQRQFNNTTDLYEYVLEDDDFSNSNTKFTNGYFCDEDYIFLRIINDNITRNSISQSRKLIKAEVLRLDPVGYGDTPQQLKFSPVLTKVEGFLTTPLMVYFFQNQLDILATSYIYQSGDHSTYGAGTDDPYHNESIIVVKWKNSVTTQQDAIFFQGTNTFELLIPDVYNWRKWVDIKPDANSDQDDGESSGNFTAPSIQTVNTSTATTDTNGSGDNYLHFPYWSRLCHHGNEFSFINDNTYDTLAQEMAISGQNYVKARYMGTTSHNVHKFGNTATYHFQFFHVYQYDENSNGAYQRYRPIKNVSNSAYYGEVAYAIIYRLTDIEENDDDYNSSIQSAYPLNQMATTSMGFDPLEEEMVELFNYYPSSPLEPEQGIVPMAGWLEKGVEQ